MPSVGNLSVFNPGVDDIVVWLQAFDSYLLANDLDPYKIDSSTGRPDPSAVSKCRAILLSSIGLSTLSTLTSILSPDKPDKKPLTELKNELTNYYQPTPKALLERYKFTARKQKPGETVSQFVAELKKMAQNCKFVASTTMTELEIRIRDQLLFGLSNEKAQNQLFQKDDVLTLDDAIKIAQAQESADASTSVVREGHPSRELEVHKATSYKKKKFNKNVNYNNSQEGKEDCGRCGSKKHNSNSCPHKSVDCFECGRKGHFASKCRTDNSKKEKGNNKFSTKTVAAIHSHKEDDDDIVKIKTKIDGVPHEWEFDTGCQKSVLNVEFWKDQLGARPLEKSDMKFRTYQNEIFEPFGMLQVNIECKGQKIKYKIPVVEGSSLFGRDLMKLFGKKNDWKEVISQINEVSSQTESSKANPLLEELIKEYDDVFSTPSGRITNFKAKIILKEDAIPRFLKARPIPYALKDKVDAELIKMEQLGHIERVDHSDWASPLVVVPKPNGKVRITGDFKNTINNQLCINQYPLASPEELFNSIAGGNKFSKLDGTDAYHQIEVDDNSKKFLVINTHRGLYRYNVLPQGIASSPAIFQECMDKIIQGIPMTGSYLDDGICTGRTDQQHLKTLKKILQRMREANYHLSREKSEFMQDKLTYLGHIITRDGILTDPSKVEDIINMEKPKNVEELRSFLGLVNFYSKFMPCLSEICSDLYQLLNDGVKWKWTTKCNEAFMKVKAEIASDKLLAHFDPSIPVGLTADASSKGLGICIFHRLPDGSERPIQFASRTLNKSEVNYSQIEKEGLSIIFGLKKFYKYLFGRKFILITDHKPLLAIFGPKTSLPPLVATRLHHWSFYMSQFQYTIEYRKTTEHGNVDALSRLPASRGPMKTEESDMFQINAVMQEALEALPVTAKQIRYYLTRDKTLGKVQRWTLSGWPAKLTEEEEELRPFFSKKEELHVQQGVLMWGSRAVIPTQLRVKLLNELHSCHSGIVRMKSLARQYIWWPGIDDDIERIAKSCTTCAAVQPNPTSAPLHPWQFPDNPWERLHVDLAGPFLGKNWLIVVDAYSKWPEIYCMHQDTTSTAVILKLREMIGRFGLPHQIVTDNGRQFVSSEFENYCKLIGVKHTTSSVYHPRSNGEAERMVQTFKNAMKKGKGDLEMRLQTFLSTYRQTPHATTGASPSELLLGRKMRSKFDLILPDVKENVSRAQQKQRENYDKTSKMRAYNEGQKVWVKTFKKGEPKWSVGNIIQTLGPVTYVVEVDGQEMKRHIDQILEATSPPKSPPEPKVEITPPPLVLPQEQTDEVEEPAAAAADEHVPAEPVVQPMEATPRRPTRVRKAPTRLAYRKKGGS